MANFKLKLHLSSLTISGIMFGGRSYGFRSTNSAMKLLEVFDPVYFDHTFISTW